MRASAPAIVLLLVAAFVVAAPSAPAIGAPIANHVVGWGFDGSCCPYTYLGQTTPPAGLTDVVAIAAGTYFSLALRGDGTVVGWGDNFIGQTQPPAGLSDVVAISAGDAHSLALRADGTVVGWGNDNQGQTTPPAGLTDVVAISAGIQYSLALRADGTVVGWGNNYSGATTPPAGLTDVVAITSSHNGHSLALRADGTVVGWGNNDYGQTTPPAGLTDAIAIAAGSDYSLAVRADGTVVGWGRDLEGASTPPAGLTDVVAIAAGYDHSLALRSDGTVVGWGYNGDGRATPPAGLAGVTAIAAGERHSLAIAHAVNLDLAVSSGPAWARTLVYSNGPATLTSGEYVVDPTTGHVSSITGIGTIPGLYGGTATVTFNVAYNPATWKYTGTFDISDPGAGFTAHIPVHTDRFGIWQSGNEVKGTLYGIKVLSTPQKCFMIVFDIEDLG
jgi:hypothetical protein